MFNAVYRYLSELLALTNEMAPYLLLGFFIAGLLHVYLPASKIQVFLGAKNLKSVILSGMLGIPLPLCSCGVIPTGISFYRNGASKGASISFLISTPQTGVDSILVTYSLLSLPFAIIRPIAALITGVVGGGLTNLVDDDTPSEDRTIEQNESSIELLTTGQRITKMFRYAFVDFLNDIAKWLVIGLLLAALLAVLIPNQFFAEQLNNQYAEMALMLIASIPLYVCATGSVPIAAVLIAKGISPGAVLVFLMAGPATNIATMLVLGKTMGRKTLFIYLSSIVVGALIFGTLINEWSTITPYFETISMNASTHVHLFPEWINWLSSLLLIGLLINGYWRKFAHKKNKKHDVMEKEITIRVKGMTCSHCKAAVEGGLKKLDGVEQAEANVVQDEVKLTGVNININAVKAAIQDLGYEYQN